MERGGAREMVAGGISFCLHPNCDHKTVNGATGERSGTQTAACAEREAYGSCTTGQKEHSATLEDEVAATKLTWLVKLTAHQTRTVDEEEEQAGGGSDSTLAKCGGERGETPSMSEQQLFFQMEFKFL